MNNIISYNSELKEKSKKLRKNSTLAEILLWNKLKGRNIRNIQFRRQKPINNYIVDFFSPQLKLVIEIDGSSHGDKIEYDEIRENKLKQLGFNILKFKDNDIKNNMESVINRIIEEIDKLTTPPLPPSKGD